MPCRGVLLWGVMCDVMFAAVFSSTILCFAVIFCDLSVIRYCVVRYAVMLMSSAVLFCGLFAMGGVSVGLL